ncbi:glutathione synthetase [Sansalvadorimonas sp. 2012CJ34-2]|uniref:glutathione synthase n=1 Tax=Parendozoicomonas callyspongiae TaxID=2942213 RepID=A0ABT0PGZ5_9GAMM|nr:glutathione synthetase [Sansalvadorimonas sp. 2012CJ34-2]MCL6270648.1 glutathione synthetase [Sansalvadorimonas sp. 2012CJ34-2]
MPFIPHPELPSQVIDEACEWAMMHGMAMKTSTGTARHCAFSLTPVAIKRDVFNGLKAATPLIARLIHNVSEDHAFVQQIMKDVSQADPFFGRLLKLHRQIHGGSSQRIEAPRQPLLMMRTDYMDGRVQGPKVVEFNGIAAGMGPFGQRIHELHTYLQNQWGEAFQHWADSDDGELALNNCMNELASGVAQTAKRIRSEAGDCGQPVFLMVVQDSEDNVYDQHLLEMELQKLGVRTVRRTFRQLHDQLYTGGNNRLMLKDIGSLDVVYLRAGYQLCDYQSTDLLEDECCEALSQTRVFIEKHAVAVNATVSQQLATSKTMQMVLTMMPPEELTRWGLSLYEAETIQEYLADMLPVTSDTAKWFAEKGDPDQWVLKNQGEGGGHCVFGEDILPAIKAMPESAFKAWALMRRLYPHERQRPALAVRDGYTKEVNDLISEVGLFTIHFNGEPLTDQNGYAGYLIRSKPSTATEGGVHSGQGMLDSLLLV